jgi:hypothetical protein
MDFGISVLLRPEIERDRGKFVDESQAQMAWRSAYSPARIDCGAGSDYSLGQIWGAVVRLVIGSSRPQART